MGKNFPDLNKQKYSVKKKVEINKVAKYSAKFDGKRYKKIRLTLSNLKINQPIILSNIHFEKSRFQKKPFKNLEKFKSDDAKLEIKDDKLIIYPLKNEVTLGYKGKINVRGSIDFDIQIFLIITILSFLLSYKLSDYLACFKIDKNASRLDIAFIAICFIIFLIPLSKINQDEISKKENRTLAVYKPLIKDGKINFNFGKDYDAWISDRFATRNWFIDIYNSFQFKIAKNIYSTQSAYLDKRTNWAFRFPVVQKPDEDILKNSMIELDKFNKYCLKNNYKLYVLIIPRKEDIYAKDTFLNKDYVDTCGKYIDKFKKQISVPIIYPHKEMHEASKDDYVFFKTDHHWTEFGAYIGYRALIKEIQKDFPTIKALKKDDYITSKNKQVKSDFARNFHTGQTSWRSLNLKDEIAKSILDTQYTYYSHKNKDLMKIEIAQIKGKLLEKNFSFKQGSDLRLLMIGTSMNENLSEFLPYTFKNSKYIRLNAIHIKNTERFKIIKLYEKILADFKPDIMVLCIAVGNIPDLRRLNRRD